MAVLQENSGLMKPVDANGNPVIFYPVVRAEDVAGLEDFVQAHSPGGKRYARVVVGTATAGWTAADCDYLCDGVDDQVEIQAAIDAACTVYENTYDDETYQYETGSILILDGNYYISSPISVSKGVIEIMGRSQGSVSLIATQSNMIIFSATENANPCFSKLDLYCADGVTSVRGIRAENCGFDVNSVSFYGFNIGVQAYRVRLSTIRNCEFSYCSVAGVSVTAKNSDAKDNNILGNVFSNCTVDIKINTGVKNTFICANRLENPVVDSGTDTVCVANYPTEESA